MSTTSNSVLAGKEDSILTVLGVSEVAEYLGVGKNRIYELLNTGKLKGFRMGSTWKISRMARNFNSDKKTGHVTSVTCPLTPYSLVAKIHPVFIILIYTVS